MDIEKLLNDYITGMEAQHVEAQRQIHMLDGALGFARQLLDDLAKDEAGGEQSPPGKHENQNA